MFPRAKVFVHTYDKAIGVEHGFEFSLDILTQYAINMDRFDEEVKVAMYTMQQSEGQKVQVTPLEREVLGQLWEV